VYVLGGDGGGRTIDYAGICIAPREVPVMPEPRDDRVASRGRLRASRADRERVIDTLKAAFVEDRLTKDEFDARVGDALASRTHADLAALTADLPATPATARR